MKTAEEIRRINSRALAKTIGGSAAFAERIDRSSTQVSRFMGKGATTEIGPKMARHIENCFHKVEGWLDVDRESSVVVEAEKDKKFFAGITERLGFRAEFINADNLNAVPILSQNQAGEWASMVLGKDSNFDWVTIAVKTSDNAFAIRISGNSMTNPYGAPSIPDGSLAIVEPCNTLENGGIVVAILDGAPGVTIKKLEIDGPQQLLIPLNPKYDPTPIKGNCHIIGYVKQVIINI